jgi:nucleotide-binding universal stress UspA family protein
MNLTVRRILVPTDFSSTAAQAIEVAIAFAQRFGAELELFHAQSMPTYVFPDAVMPVGPELMRDLDRAVASELERNAERVRAAGVVVSTASAVGAPDLEICRRAGEWNADLIIIGTHGRTGLPHVLLGSVAEKVVRRAPCPVLTVRPEAAEHVATP